jgi:hypothetical protein
MGKVRSKVGVRLDHLLEDEDDDGKARELMGTRDDLWRVLRQLLYYEWVVEGAD